MEKEQQNSTVSEIDAAYLKQGQQGLSALLASLKPYCGRPLDPEALILLWEIRSFLTKRFRYEEKFMILRGNNDFFIHQQQHALFIDNLTWSIETARRNKQIPAALCDFLAEWYEFHSANLDRAWDGLKPSPGQEQCCLQDMPCP